MNVEYEQILGFIEPKYRENHRFIDSTCEKIDQLLKIYEQEFIYNDEICNAMHDLIIALRFPSDNKVLLTKISYLKLNWNLLLELLEGGNVHAYYLNFKDAIEIIRNHNV